MKIALYDPYLNTQGGGERYLCTIAESLSKNNKTDIFWDDIILREKLQKTLNLDLHLTGFRKNIFSSQIPIVKRVIELAKYDRLFFLSDGSLPIVTAKKNYLHFQFPVNWIKISLKDKLKIKLFSKVICNSYFTKKFIDKTYQTKSIVIYPPVDLAKFKSLPKENIILSVGRFTTAMHSKRQDILVDSFKKMCDHGLKNWQLILAGGLDNDGNEFINNLKSKTSSYPVQILPNISFDKLVELYGKSSIYWHAAGFGINTEKEPWRTEHFGITIVEAMASGCIPFIVNNGGQTEIVENDINGFTYDSIEELIGKTQNLISSPETQLRIRENSKEKSRHFSKDRFCQEIKKAMEIA